MDDSVSLITNCNWWLSLIYFYTLDGYLYFTDQQTNYLDGSLAEFTELKPIFDFVEKEIKFEVETELVPLLSYSKFVAIITLLIPSGINSSRQRYQSREQLFINTRWRPRMRTGTGTRIISKTSVILCISPHRTIRFRLNFSHSDRRAVDFITCNSILSKYFLPHQLLSHPQSH